MTLAEDAAVVAKLAAIISGAPWPTAQSRAKAAAVLRALDAHLRETERVVVPREPTEAMLDAAVKDTCAIVSYQDVTRCGTPCSAPRARTEGNVAEHEPCTGATDDWYTPPEIFVALGLTFDFDPCSPGPGHWVPARQIYTKADDGLAQPWRGMVFVNPPFGGRHGHVPWLRRFLDHGNGVAIVRAYTSAGWFHDHMPRAEVILFPRGKTKFIRPDGSVGTAPGHGVVLVGMGERACTALLRSGLGMPWHPQMEIRNAG